MTYDINNLDKFDDDIDERQIFTLNDKKGNLKNTIIYDSIKSFILQDRQEAYNAGRQSVIEEIDKDKRLMNCYEGCSCRERLLKKLKQGDI
jgi:hypothetical protein